MSDGRKGFNVWRFRCCVNDVALHPFFLCSTRSSQASTQAKMHSTEIGDVAWELCVHLVRRGERWLEL